jgi:hypothetical protein
MLRHKTEPRFKLGWSLHPTKRALDLPEYEADELDLAASLVVWLPSRASAEQVERAMHKLLRASAVKPSHLGDGATEWFHLGAWDHAVRMLQTIPQDAAGHRVATVQPFGRAPGDAPLGIAMVGGCAMQTLLRIEALLVEVARQVPVVLQPQSAPMLRFVGLNRWWTPPDVTDPDFEARTRLRAVVMDAETYQFHRQGRVYSFVEWLTYVGHDLVLQFKPLAPMEEWDAQLHLPTQVRAMLRKVLAHGPLLGEPLPPPFEG